MSSINIILMSVLIAMISFITGKKVGEQSILLKMNKLMENAKKIVEMNADKKEDPKTL